MVLSLGRTGLHRRFCSGLLKSLQEVLGIMLKMFHIKYILFLGAVLLTGCSQRKAAAVDTLNRQNGPDNGADRSMSQEMVQIPDKFMKLEGNVTFDTQIDMGKEFPMVLYSASAKKMEHDTIFNRLFEQVQITEEQTLDMDNDDGSKGKAYYYTGNNGEKLSITDSGIRYYTPDSYYILNSFQLKEYDENYNAGQYSPDRDFSFETRTGALKKVMEGLEQLGVHLDNAYGYNSYSLDYQTLKDLEYVIDQDGNKDIANYKPGWSEADNCYYFCIWQEASGLPVAYKYTDIFGYNAPIQVIYSERGFEMIHVDKTFHFTSKETQPLLKPFEQVAASVTKKYNDLLTDSTYTVTKASLCNWAMKNKQNQYEVMPVWVLDITEQSNHTDDSYHINMVIDAQTAKELII